MPWYRASHLHQQVQRVDLAAKGNDARELLLQKPHGCTVGLGVVHDYGIQLAMPRNGTDLLHQLCMYLQAETKRTIG